MENTASTRLADTRLAAKIQASLQRAASMPVVQERDKFVAMFRNNQIMVVSSDTGTGKSAMLPLFVLLEQMAGKMIAVTQPRRLTTRSVAKYVAEWLGVKLGREIGYRVRGDDVACKDTRIVYMTDGRLLAESYDDPRFTKYSTIIIDEAHERSVPTDILLILLKNATETRKDLSVIIMSATIDTAKFANYFGGAPVLEIQGQRFPVDILHLEKATANYENTLVKVALHIHSKEPDGDVLIFLLGEHEIKQLCLDLSVELPGNAEFLPLYAGLRKEQQDEATAGPVAGRRKFILATNVAETSITVPGIMYVIDIGLFKEMRYSPGAEASSLQLKCISKAAAKQRAGRTGRVRPGKVFRLYTKKHFDEDMGSTSQPNIQLSNFSATLLRMTHAGLGKPLTFDLVDRPDQELVFGAWRELRDLDLITDNGSLTAHGQRAAALPVEPIWYRALDVAQDMNCLPEMITMAAIAGNQTSIYKRLPLSMHGAAYAARDAFAHPQSDHITQLNTVYAYMQAKKTQGTDMDQWCHELFLNRQAIEEVIETREHLCEQTKRMGANLRFTPIGDERYAENLRKALALGLFRHTAWREKSDEWFRTIHSNQAALLRHDSQLRASRNVEWVVYSEFYVGGRAFIDTVTAVDPEWIVDLPYFQVSRMPKRGKDGLGETPVMEELAEALNKVRVEKEEREQATQGSQFH